MAKETRNALLYAQLQKDLKYALMKAPVCLESKSIRSSYVAARNKECYSWEDDNSTTGRIHLSLGQIASVEGVNLVMTGHRVPEVWSQNKVEASTPRETAGNCGGANQRRSYIYNSPNHLNAEDSCSLSSDSNSCGEEFSSISSSPVNVWSISVEPPL